MEKTVVKRFAPFTPLAKPLGPLDPMPVFKWKEKIEPAPEYRPEIDGKNPLTKPTRPVELIDPYEVIDPLKTELEGAAWMREWIATIERSNNMRGLSLVEAMALVENATTVRIDLNGEEMLLTPHRLAIYASCKVSKVFVNIAGELEMELEGI